MSNRLTRAGAAKMLPCSLTKLHYLEKSGLLKGCFYNVGTRRFYITDKLTAWCEVGGEQAAIERREKGENYNGI